MLLRRDPRPVGRAPRRAPARPARARANCARRPSTGCRVGLFGLAGMLPLVSLADVIMDRAKQVGGAPTGRQRRRPWPAQARSASPCAERTAARHGRCARTARVAGAAKPAAGPAPPRPPGNCIPQHARPWRTAGGAVLSLAACAPVLARRPPPLPPERRAPLGLFTSLTQIRWREADGLWPRSICRPRKSPTGRAHVLAEKGTASAPLDTLLQPEGLCRSSIIAQPAPAGAGGKRRA